MKTKYPEGVEQIHREFLTAGDNLLAEATAILDRANENDVEKGQRLANLGFTSTREAQLAVEVEKEADKAAKSATRAGNAKAHVAGVDRAIGLRSYKVVQVLDMRAALKWLFAHDPAAVQAFIVGYAERHAPTRPMDRVEVTTERKVA